MAATRRSHRTRQNDECYGSSTGKMSTVLPTILGLVAIVLWGTTIPMSRHAAEQLGAFSSAAAVYLTSGAIGCLYLLASGRTRVLRSQMPRKYLFGCGGLMVAYSVLLYSAIGFAKDGPELITITVANYLWPGLTLVLSVPILGNKARGDVLCGAVLLSTAGQWLTVSGMQAAWRWGYLCRSSRRWRRPSPGHSIQTSAGAGPPAPRALPCHYLFWPLGFACCCFASWSPNGMCGRRPRFSRSPIWPFSRRCRPTRVGTLPCAEAIWYWWQRPVI